MIVCTRAAYRPKKGKHSEGIDNHERSVTTQARRVSPPLQPCRLQWAASRSAWFIDGSTVGRWAIDRVHQPTGSPPSDYCLQSNRGKSEPAIPPVDQTIQSKAEAGLPLSLPIKLHQLRNGNIAPASQAANQASPTAQQQETSALLLQATSQGNHSNRPRLRLCTSHQLRRETDRSSPSILEDDDEHNVVDEVEAQIHRHEKRRCLAVVRRKAHPNANERRQRTNGGEAPRQQLDN